MTKIHIALSDDPLIQGQSFRTVCGKRLSKIFFTGFIDQEVTCFDCRVGVWDKRFVTPVAEADEVPDLVKNA